MMKAIEAFTQPGDRSAQKQQVGLVHLTGMAKMNFAVETAIFNTKVKRFGACEEH